MSSPDPPQTSPPHQIGISPSQAHWTGPPPPPKNQSWTRSASPTNHASTTSFFSNDSAYFFGAPGTFGSVGHEEPGSDHSESDEGSQSDLEHALIDSLLEPLESKCTDPADEVYQGSSVLRPMPMKTPPSYASKLLLSNPNEIVLSSSPAAQSTKICPFFLQNSCRYASHCRYRHDFGSSCPQCGAEVPLDEKDQMRHIVECAETVQLAEERRQSSNLKCEICFEYIVRTGRRFGLLQGCTHAFCLTCIRNWRGSAGQPKETLRSCPMCRQDSHFVIPSDRMVTDPIRKAKVIEKYTGRLRQIECKWFARGKGTCPFGSSCFYAHLSENGSIAEPERLQHGANADGLIEVMKPMRLSDFFANNT